MSSTNPPGPPITLGPNHQTQAKKSSSTISRRLIRMFNPILGPRLELKLPSLSSLLMRPLIHLPTMTLVSSRTLKPTKGEGSMQTPVEKSR